LASLGLLVAGGALSVVSGLIALAVSFAAYRYLKIGDVGLLTYLSLSFTFLGVGLMLQGVMSLILGLRLGNVYEDARLMYFMGITYLMVENLAYLLLVIGYTRETFWRGASSLAPLIIITPSQLRRYFLLGHLVFDASQVLSILLLMIILFEGFLLSTRSGSSFSRLVLLAFTVLLLAHVTMLYASATMTPFYYIVGELVQFASFLLLLAFLIRWYRVE